MSDRSTTRYTLLTAAWADGTSDKVAYAQDFRHSTVTVTTITSFTWDILVKWSRVEKWSDVDFTAAASATNPWSYIQLTRNDTWVNLDWATWLVLSTSAWETFDIAVNIDWFNWFTVEVNNYSAWTVSVSSVLYGNQ